LYWDQTASGGWLQIAIGITARLDNKVSLPESGVTPEPLQIASSIHLILPGNCLATRRLAATASITTLPSRSTSTSLASIVTSGLFAGLSPTKVANLGIKQQDASVCARDFIT
jgi:hypothetical protein